MISAIKRLITQLIDWILYTVLSEKNRQTIANLFSDRQKEFIKRFTQHGKRHQQKHYIKHIKDNLYSLGLRKQALKEFERILTSADDAYLIRLAAWELVLWHVNKLTKQGAEQALTYIRQAREGERDPDQLRRICIIEVECLARLDRIQDAKQTLENFMAEATHPDLYFARANLEENIADRLTWMNKVYEHYSVNPITFTSLNEPHYDLLTMKEREKPKDEQAKVSIIMPCYNAEDGVQTAINSLLAQTWQNIELLLVDDQSTDNTLQVIKNYAKKDNRIKVFSTEENSGPYIARNIALQQATGEFITINDADDWSHEKKIETQVRHLLENDRIIANTSSHARLTEDLHIYRRGTPGRYMFPNMSSIMFRREQVMEKLGYWDSVRFAADGEFKRRLLQAFGDQSFIDLDTAPLSLPRQTVSSLTGSSAFGYNGFFMGVRKEYVESLEYFHEQTDSLYYPFPSSKRPFPVPEPMWPRRKVHNNGTRHIHHVVAADYRQTTGTYERAFQQLFTKTTDSLGLVQLYAYDLSLPLEIEPTIREKIDGEQCQMLVYGEEITSDILTIIDYDILSVEQIYIPKIEPKTIQIVLTNIPKQSITDMEQQVQKTLATDLPIDWIPLSRDIRTQLEKTLSTTEITSLAKEDWVMSND